MGSRHDWSVLGVYVLAVVTVVSIGWLIWELIREAVTVFGLGRRKDETVDESDEKRARDVIEGARRDEVPEWDPHTDLKGNGNAKTARPNETDLADLPEWERELQPDEDPVDPPMPMRSAVVSPGDDLQLISPHDSGVHALPPGLTCSHCEGTGVRTIPDLLTESVGLIPDPKALVLELYRRLVAKAPHLAELFPPDLLVAAINDTGARGALQRDKLLEAILAVEKWYKPTDPEAMATLNNALISMGNRHHAFWRPSLNRARPATVREFGVVIEVFLDTAHALVPGWSADHDMAWDDALDHVSRKMLVAIDNAIEEAQAKGQDPFPRMPRERRPGA